MLKTLIVMATMIAMGFYLVAVSEKGKDETVWFSHDGIDRRTIVHIPHNPSSEKLPAVFVFHGLMGNSIYTKNTYGMTELADSEKFIAVYPEGTGPLKSLFLSWNVGFCCGYAFENGVDDVGYIVELIKHLESVYPIDPDRIFLVGLSNGGMLTYKLVSEYPQLFAAAAVVSSSPAGGANELEVFRIPAPSAPVPMIIFNGMLDPIIPYDGGFYGDSEQERIYFPSILESVDLWADGMKASELQREELENGRVILNRYTGEDSRSEIHFYTIVDGDHTWPGREKGLDALQSSSKSSIKASELIWEFLKDRSR
jgi:polyhydroxybutyrate depolymerase